MFEGAVGKPPFNVRDQLRPVEFFHAQQDHVVVFAGQAVHQVDESHDVTRLSSSGCHLRHYTCHLAETSNDDGQRPRSHVRNIAATVIAGSPEASNAISSPAATSPGRVTAR